MSPCEKVQRREGRLLVLYNEKETQHDREIKRRNYRNTTRAFIHSHSPLSKLARYATVRSVGKTRKNPVTNSMTVILYVLVAFVKGGVICDKSGSLIVTIYRHIHI